GSRGQDAVDRGAARPAAGAGAVAQRRPARLLARGSRSAPPRGGRPWSRRSRSHPRPRRRGPPRLPAARRRDRRGRSRGARALALSAARPPRARLECAGRRPIADHAIEVYGEGVTAFADAIRQGIPETLPDPPPEIEGIDRAPRRPDVLDRRQ